MGRCSMNKTRVHLMNSSPNLYCRALVVTATPVFTQKCSDSLSLYHRTLLSRPDCAFWIIEFLFIKCCQIFFVQIGYVVEDYPETQESNIFFEFIHDSL